MVNLSIIRFISIITLCFYSWLGAQNEVYLKIQADGYQRIDIIVAPFKSDFPSDYPPQIRAVVINDLQLSGFFRIVEEDKLLLAKQAEQTQHQNHAQTQVAALLDGTVEIQEKSLVISARLYDLPDKNLIFNKKLKTTISSMRWLAHQLSDEVVYYLIGEHGIACTKLAYITGDQGIRDLMTIDYDGYGIKKLTKSKTLNLSPRWSPDGVQIVFTSYTGRNPDLMLLQLDKGKITKLSDQPGLNTAPAWSADGSKIALTLTRDGNAEIYSMNANGSDLRRLTSHPAIDTSPSWAPDGREIAFTSDRSGAPQIYLMDSEGGNIRRLTYEGNYNDSPAWSPRGDRICFVSRIENRFHIHTIDVTGENLRRLTDGSGNNENPAWSPNGLKIAFASNRAGKWDIYIMNWDGTQVRRLTNSGDNFSPTWSPRLKTGN